MSDRYDRQTMIPEIGDDGQRKLADAKVLVIGAGGLGTTIIYHLAAAGVGTIGVADNDIVSLSNLNRQFIHFEDDIGKEKVVSAKEKINKFNSEIKVVPYASFVDENNANEIIKDYDIVAIAVDNQKARNIINKACVDLDKPFADGGVNGFVGTSSFFVPGETPCLSCLYGLDLPPEENYSAVSSVVGMIASIETTSVLQYILGLPIPLKGNLLYCDAMNAEFDTLPLKFNKTCPICGGKRRS